MRSNSLQYLDGPLTADCVVNGTSLKILVVSLAFSETGVTERCEAPLKRLVDTLMHAEKCKIDWGSLFRLGEQVSYLLMC